MSIIELAQSVAQAEDGKPVATYYLMRPSLGRSKFLMCAFQMTLQCKKNGPHNFHHATFSIKYLASLISLFSQVNDLS